MTLPEVDDRAVKHLLRGYLDHLGDDPRRRLVLVHGRYVPSAPTRFVIDLDDGERSVVVSDEQSVLGVVSAWQEHRGADTVLVVTTGVPDTHLGWELRGHAVGRRTLSVDPVEIVTQRFGAGEVDPRIRREPWLLHALLDAEPAAGWPRTGPVLTRDAAIRALLSARFATNDPFDAGSLLEWSRTRAGPARFRELGHAEQDGLSAWLTESVGPFATIFLAFIRQGRALDVMALGLVISVLDRPGTSSDAAIAVGSLLQGSYGAAERRALVDAVGGTLERWVLRVEGGGPAGEEARRRVMGVVERADELAGAAGLADDVRDHPFLLSGLHGRLAALAAAVVPEPTRDEVAAAQVALERLQAHRLGPLFPARLEAAAMAVRLLRWLAEPAPTADSVARAARSHLSEGGWVDRALALLWVGDPDADQKVGRAYGVLHDAVRRRRDAQDEGFASLLRAWTEQADATAPGGALVIERVLDEVVVPLLPFGPPLVLVVDGMSAAVAVELGEEALDRGWTEIGRDADARDAAIAVIPSLTRVSRSSLLAGRATAADETPERDGFVAFWKRHRREASLLLKGDLAGGSGRRFSERLVADLAGDGIVAIVLNTVDDALDHGREGDRTRWRLADVTYLADLLDAARGYGRPVVLVSDHGHVLDHTGPDSTPTRADGIQGARWRRGTAGDGEVALTGPRVLRGDGAVVVPWREDVRYLARRAGYHGGASLAEMTVPVLVLLPGDASHRPMGWSVLPAESTRPTWWTGRAAPAEQLEAPPAPVRSSRKPTAARVEVGEGLFAAPEPVAAPASTPPQTLGRRVVATAVFTQQRTFVRRAPAPSAVADLVDALDSAGGELSATAAVAELGRAGREPAPILAAAERLLNVEGYTVLSSDGRHVRLDREMLRLQFGLGTA